MFKSVKILPLLFLSCASALAQEANVKMNPNTKEVTTDVFPGTHSLASNVILPKAATTGGGSTALDGIATVGVPVGRVSVVVAGDNAYTYCLRAGTEAENDPYVIRPDDYNASTNAKFWFLLYPKPETLQPAVLWDFVNDISRVTVGDNSVAIDASAILFNGHLFTIYDDVIFNDSFDAESYVYFGDWVSTGGFFETTGNVGLYGNINITATGNFVFYGTNGGKISPTVTQTAGFTAQVGVTYVLDSAASVTVADPAATAGGTYFVKVVRGTGIVGGVSYAASNSTLTRYCQTSTWATLASRISGDQQIDGNFTAGDAAGDSFTANSSNPTAPNVTTMASGTSIPNRDAGDGRWVKISDAENGTIRNVPIDALGLTGSSSGLSACAGGYLRFHSGATANSTLLFATYTNGFGGENVPARNLGWSTKKIAFSAQVARYTGNTTGITRLYCGTTNTGVVLANNGAGMGFEVANDVVSGYSSGPSDSSPVTTALTGTPTFPGSGAPLRLKAVYTPANTTVTWYVNDVSVGTRVITMGTSSQPFGVYFYGTNGATAATYEILSSPLTIQAF